MLPEANDNTDFFLAHVMRPFTRFVPDFAALAPLAGRIVVAGGEDSRTHDVHRPAVALAERLDKELVMFPGGHVGYAKWPDEFGLLLRTVLAESAPARGGGGRGVTCGRWGCQRPPPRVTRILDWPCGRSSQSGMKRAVRPCCSARAISVSVR